MKNKIIISVLFILTACVSQEITPVSTPSSGSSVSATTSVPTIATSVPTPVNTPHTISPIISSSPGKTVQAVKIYDKLGFLLADSTSDKPPLLLQLHQSLNFNAKVTFNDSTITDNIVWRSSDETIMTIESDGTATGQKEGKAEIIIIQKDTQKELFKTAVFVIEACKDQVLSACNEKVVVIGKVYDSDTNILDGVKITEKSLDLCCPFNEEQLTVNGEFTIKKISAGTRLEITASKDGFNTKKRIEILKSNLDLAYVRNVFNFGGPAPPDKVYALPKN